MKTDRSVLVETIKNSVPILRAVDHYGLEPNRLKFIKCPFHQENTPSLRIYPETNTFYCFGCGVGGDVISFVRHLFHVDFWGAVMRLDQDFHLCLPTRRATTGEQAQARIQRHIEARKREEKEWLEFFYHEHYSAFLRLHRRLWRASLLKFPKSPEIAPEPEYLESIHWLDYVIYWLDTYTTFEKWKEVYG